MQEGSYKISTRTKRISSYRTRKIYLIKLWTGSGIWRRFPFRFDDTNPTKEKEEYVNSIKEDVEWLGADYHEHIYYASNYFDKMYECAEFLIKKGKAYVCDLNAEQIREYRGTLTEPGKNSPYRDRTPEENLQLFREMKEGKYPDGSKVLRAKIDMTSGNNQHEGSNSLSYRKNGTS